MKELVHSWNRMQNILLDPGTYEKLCRQRKCTIYIYGKCKCILLQSDVVSKFQ